MAAPSSRSRRRVFQNLRDAAQRDEDPVGAVVEFVGDFVDRFFEQVNIEQHLQRRGIFRDE